MSNSTVKEMAATIYSNQLSTLPGDATIAGPIKLRLMIAAARDAQALSAIVDVETDKHGVTVNDLAESVHNDPHGTNAFNQRIAEAQAAQEASAAPPATSPPPGAQNGQPDPDAGGHVSENQPNTETSDTQPPANQSPSAPADAPAQ